MVLRREIFLLKFLSRVRKRYLKKIRFLACEFLFTCGNFTLIFTVFSIFWIGFFSEGFIVHCRASFLFDPSFDFSLMVFLFTCDILTMIFCSFLFYLINSRVSKCRRLLLRSFLSSNRFLFCLALTSCNLLFQ